MDETIIEEFRSNHGRVGGVFQGRPLLLLRSIGAKSGIERICPLMYQEVPAGLAVFASKGGADTNPHWFHNLRAHPGVEVEVGDEVRAVTARVAEGDEHDRIWTKQKSDWPQFAEYERKTRRASIPVVVLEAG